MKTAQVVSTALTNLTNKINAFALLWSGAVKKSAIMLAAVFAVACPGCKVVGFLLEGIINGALDTGETCGQKLDRERNDAAWKQHWESSTIDRTKPAD